MTSKSQLSTRSTWLSRAAAVVVGLAVAVGPLVAVPAQAKPVALAVTISPNPVNVTVGKGGVSVTVTLTNSNPLESSDNVQASVSMSGVENHADMTVNQGGCQSVQGDSVGCGELPPLGTISFNVDVTPKSNSDLATGQTANGTLTVSISPPNSGTASAGVTVTGGNQIATGISGTVTDLKGDPIEGVKVAAKDSKDKTFEATTGGDGTFNIDGQVAAGAVEVTYTKEGYEEAKQSFTANAGEKMNADTRMEEVAKEEEPSTSPSEVKTSPEAKDNETGLSTTMWVLIILGALLVIGGIVAIVLLIRKGKKDDDDDDDLPPLPDVPSMHRPSATQTGHLGVYDAATRRPGMDAPTMIHNGPLINDGDLARYGSEPAAPGFGPSYDDSRPTQLVDPGRGDDRSTRMFPTSGPPSDRGYPTSGAPGGYPASGPPADRGYPTSGAPGGYPASGPPADRGYPTSGAPGGYPASGPPADRGYPTSGAPGGYPASGPPADRGYPTSGAPGGYPPPADQTRAYPSAHDDRGGPQQGQWGQPPAPQQDQWGQPPAPQRDQWGQPPAPQRDQWGQQSQDPRGSQRGQDNWGGGYEEQPRQERPRRYRADEDGYDDRPQSW